MDLAEEGSPLSGRTALVTGAARRIGRAVAEELARAGADVVVHARSSLAGAERLAGELRALGRRAWTAQADQRDPEALRAACEEAEERTGGIDILVNSAAVWPRTALDACTVEDYDLALETNLRGPFFWARWLGPRMRRRGRGAIVSLGDAAAFRPSPDAIPYALAKAGLEAMTYGLAKALAPEVRVAALALGPILFPPDHPVEAIEADRRATLRGREGSPEEVARAVRFLCVNEDITGVVLPVDGGYRFGV